MVSACVSPTVFKVFYCSLNVELNIEIKVTKEQIENVNGRKDDRSVEVPRDNTELVTKLFSAFNSAKNCQGVTPMAPHTMNTEKCRPMRLKMMNLDPNWPLSEKVMTIILRTVCHSKSSMRGVSGSKSPTNTVDNEARLLSLILDPQFINDHPDRLGVAAMRFQQKVSKKQLAKTTKQQDDLTTTLNNMEKQLVQTNELVESTEESKVIHAHEEMGMKDPEQNIQELDAAFLSDTNVKTTFNTVVTNIF